MAPAEAAIRRAAPSVSTRWRDRQIDSPERRVRFSLTPRIPSASAGAPLHPSRHLPRLGCDSRWSRPLAPGPGRHGCRRRRSSVQDPGPRTLGRPASAIPPVISSAPGRPRRRGSTARSESGEAGGAGAPTRGVIERRWSPAPAWLRPAAARGRPVSPARAATTPPRIRRLPLSRPAAATPPDRPSSRGTRWCATARSW